jgi:N-acetylgalactosamine-6-sulfatase
MIRARVGLGQVPLSEEASMATRGIIVLLLGVAALTGCTSAASRVEPPNVVVIVADGLGVGDVGCFGSGDVKTPGLDAVAAAGVRFTRFYGLGESTATRASLMTGRYPQRYPGLEADIGPGGAGLYPQAAALAERDELGLLGPESVLPVAFKERGYLTAAFGKWHLGYPTRFHPRKHGFDRAFSVVGDQCDPFHHHELSLEPVLFVNEQPVRRMGYLTSLIGDDATDFLRHNHAQPFFLYVAFTAPNAPLRLPGDIGPRCGEEQWRRGTREAYAGMVAALDAQVARIDAELARLGVADRTLTLVLSPHGAAAPGSNGKLRGGRGELYEGGLRAPLIARWPGRLPAGAQSDQVTAAFDLTASMLASVRGQAFFGRPLDGEDVLGEVARGRDVRPRELAWRTRREGRVSAAILEGDLKLIREGNAPGSIQLFDLAADASETNDLAQARPRDAQRLASRLERWERRTTTEPPRKD